MTPQQIFNVVRSLDQRIASNVGGIMGFDHDPDYWDEVWNDPFKRAWVIVWALTIPGITLLIAKFRASGETFQSDG